MHLLSNPIAIGSTDILYEASDFLPRNFVDNSEILALTTIVVPPLSYVFCRNLASFNDRKLTAL